MSRSNFCVYRRFLSGLTVGIVLGMGPAIAQSISQEIPPISPQTSSKGTLKSCGHRLVSVEGGRISRQSAGQGEFSSVGGSAGLCSDDVLHVPRRVRVRVRCAGTGRDRRFFSGQNAVRRLCSTGGVSVSRGSATTLLSLPYATHVASAKPKVLAYVAVTNAPNSNDVLKTTFEIFDPRTFEFVVSQPLKIPLKDLNYRPDPKATAVAGSPQGIYDGVLLIDTAEFETMPELEAEADYQWALAEDVGDGEITAFTQGLIHYLPYGDSFNPAQTAQSDPSKSYKWLVDHDYGGEALVLIALKRLRPRRSPDALTQWQMVLSVLDRSDQSQQELETRLRETSILAVP